MKLVTFSTGTGPDRIGVLRPDRSILDLAEAVRTGPQRSKQLPTDSMVSLIEGGETALNLVRDLCDAPPESAFVPPETYRLRAPIPLPPQMRDFMCFERHLLQAIATVLKTQAANSPDPERFMAEARAQGKDKIHPNWYKQPVYYKCNRFSTSADGDVIHWPAYSKLIDYELELACVIGRGGRDIPKERARGHIFGFTILNDWSARDAQFIEMPCMLGPAKGKDFDGANTLGPCLVTLDEIGDPYALEMTVRVNGQERGRGNSSAMHWKFEEVIAHVSQAETLHPGEILGSGTVGNGCGLELNRYLEDGDVVELAIDRIGTLCNRVSRG